MQEAAQLEQRFTDSELNAATILKKIAALKEVATAARAKIGLSAQMNPTQILVSEMGRLEQIQQLLQ
jgi:hypothetical protein